MSKTRSTRRKPAASKAKPPPATKPATPTPEPVPKGSEDEGPGDDEDDKGDEEDDEGKSESPESCPTCEGTEQIRDKSEPAKTWVMCEACETWYHWDCVGQGRPLETVDKWYVPSFVHPVLSPSYKRI